MREGQTDPEILIIGGGVVGLSIARALHKKDVRQITVVDQSTCGREASWAAAGMLGPDVEANAGGPFFDLCARSRDMYPEFAAELADETGVDIELDQTGTLFVALGDEDSGRLLERCGRQSAAGIAVEVLSAGQAAMLEPALSTSVKIAALYEGDWQVENRRLLEALRAYADKHGIDVLEETQVESVIVDGGRVTGAQTQNGRRLSAGRTVLATGAWTSLIKLGLRQMPFDTTPVRGQIVQFRSSRPKLRHVIESELGYLVPRRDGRVLAGSTSENVGFDRSTSEDGVDQLAAMAGQLVPSLKEAPLTDRWAGLRPFVADGLPVLGEIDGIEGLFIATAHYRNGILLAPVTAKLAAECLADGQRSNYLELFGPGRFQGRYAGAN